MLSTDVVQQATLVLRCYTNLPPTDYAAAYAQWEMLCPPHLQPQQQASEAAQRSREAFLRWLPLSVRTALVEELQSHRRVDGQTSGKQKRTVQKAPAEKVARADAADIAVTFLSVLLQPIMSLPSHPIPADNTPSSRSHTSTTLKCWELTCALLLRFITDAGATQSPHLYATGSLWERLVESRVHDSLHAWSQYFLSFFLHQIQTERARLAAQRVVTRTRPSSKNKSTLAFKTSASTPQEQKNVTKEVLSESLRTEKRRGIALGGFPAQLHKHPLHFYAEQVAQAAQDIALASAVSAASCPEDPKPLGSAGTRQGAQRRQRRVPQSSTNGIRAAPARNTTAKRLAYTRKRRRCSSSSDDDSSTSSSEATSSSSASSTASRASSIDRKASSRLQNKSLAHCHQKKRSDEHDDVPLALLAPLLSRGP